MDKHFRNIFLCILSLSVFTVLLGACENAGRNQQDRLRKLRVRGHTVEAADLGKTVNYPAMVVPLNEISLRSGLEGSISDVYVSDREQVQPGQRLYAIDRSRHQTAFEEAEARLERARAREREARERVERNERREEADGVGAGQQAVMARSDLRKATAEVEEAEKELEAASNRLEESIVRAPFAGTMGTSGLRVGSRVSVDQALNVLNSDRLAAVDMMVKEPQIAKFDSLRYKDPQDSVFMLFYDNGMPYPHPGVIGAIDRSANRQPGTITIRLIFPNPEGALKTGMRMQVRVKSGDLGEQIVIPERAVLRKDETFYVYVVKADTIQRRVLRLGARARDLVVVRDGLEKGEVIVIDRPQGLREGSRVELVSGPIRPPQAQANEER